MNPKINTVNLDQQTVKMLYDHYKPYTVPIVTIFVCILIVWFFIVPQIQALNVLQDQVKAEKQKVDVLSRNYDILTSIDGAQLNDKMQIVSRALPDTKDYMGIVQSLSNAASLSGVSLGDYGLAIGDISGSTKNKKEIPVNVVVNLTGDLQKVETFIAAMKNQMPLSSISDVSIVNGGGNASFTILFYYAAFPTVKIDLNSPITVIPSQANKLIAQLKDLQSQIPVGTPEASVSPTPTESIPSVNLSPFPTPEISSQSANQATGSGF